MLETDTMWYHLYVEPKKIIQMNLYTRQKQTQKHKKQTFKYQRGKVGGRDKLRVSD